MNQENIILIVITILVVIAVVIRRWYIKLPRSYAVSEQFSSGHKLTVIEHNPKDETALIELCLRYSQLMPQPPTLFFEFIGRKKESLRVKAEDLDAIDIETHNNTDTKEIRFLFKKRELLVGMTNKQIPTYRIRFVIAIEPHKLIKSHTLEFNSKLLLFQPEIGKAYL